jgi:hypothetical protein
MYTVLVDLIDRLDKMATSETKVIPWSCPVPSFGDLSKARIATLGLNPSNREFVDESGNELQGSLRRFHTLKSLGLTSWSEVDTRHLCTILDSFNQYFVGNPYDRWFKVLDGVLSGLGASYYNTAFAACHLDLIPYATECKWAELSLKQQSTLMVTTSDIVGRLLRDSSISILILNGRTVVEEFQNVVGLRLNSQEMADWSLPRKTKQNIGGVAYSGVIDSVLGIPLEREVMVLGYNHNLQSSYGVTTEVVSSIRKWIAQASKEFLQ